MKTQSLASFLISIGLGVALFHWAALSTQNFKPEDIGLGLNTRAVESFFRNKPISTTEKFEDIQETISHFKNKKNQIALWLGASQLYSVNHYRPDDEIAIYHANALAEDRNANLIYVQWATPNASLHDLLTYYLIQRQSGQSPDWLIIALTFDDLREVGIKEESLRLLKPLSETDQNTVGQGVLNLYKEQALLETPEAMHSPSPAMRETPHEKLEDGIVRYMNQVWGAYQYRGKLLAGLNVMFSNLFNRKIIQLFPRKVPSIPNHAIQWNMQAFESLVQLAKADGVKILVYKPPHRPGAKTFYYNESKFNAFFDNIKIFCEKENVHYADFEKQVPDGLWGLTNSGRPDIFHFRGEGHRLLGKAIDETLGQLSGALR